MVTDRRSHSCLTHGCCRYRYPVGAVGCWRLVTCKAYAITVGFRIDEFGLTIFVDVFPVGLLARDDVVDGAFARDVFDLTTGEFVFISQAESIFLSELVHHREPYQSSYFSAWFFEFNFEKESALKSLVKVGSEIGCGDEDAIESLHLLEDDVLHSVVHFID